MTTCPRCGRVADDEIVCAGCGLSLALVRRTTTPDSPTVLMDRLAFDDDDEADAPDPRAWRLAALVGVCCLIVVAAAVLLMHSGGGAKKDTARSSPTTGASRAAAAPIGSSGPSSTPEQPGAGRSSATPSAGRTPSRSVAPTRSTPTSRPRTSPAAAIRSVQVARGALDGTCGPHCYRVAVTLSSFGSGTHHVTCWSAHGGQFGAYDTSATTSTGCSFRHPHDSVWVIVDGTYHSNTVNW